MIHIEKFLIQILVSLMTIACLQCNVACAASSPLSHIQEKHITIDGHAVFYDEMGKGADIVLVHGLFANKEQWLPMLHLLAQHGYHVVALDLPGYGKSTGFPFEDYDLKQQVRLLHIFTTKLKINKFNIAGSSMGGAISALYALKYPNEIMSVAFIGAPLGIQSPILSETNQLFNQGQNPFVPVNEQQFDRLLHLIFVKPPHIPVNEVEKYIRVNKAHEAMKDKIVKVALRPYRTLFERNLFLSKNVLIIWGDKDKIFDVSGATKLQNNLPHSILVILKNAGHLPQVENTSVVVPIYVAFLNNTV